MSAEEEQTEEDLSQDLVRLWTAMRSLFRRLPNARKAVDKLTGGLLSDGARALASRLHRYRTANLVDEARQIANASGMPLPAVFTALVRQRRIDELTIDSLRLVNRASPSASGRPEHEEEVTSDRWFQTFYDEAGMVDEDDVREVFLRILAGEIKTPGSFSLQTLRVVGTIDQRTAQDFRRAVSVRISVEFRFRGRVLIHDERVPSIGDGLGSNALKEEGLGYSVLQGLMEHGLIFTDLASSMPYGTSATVTQNGIIHSIPILATHQEEKWLLTPVDETKKATGVRVEGVGFTSCGRELMGIVDTEKMPNFRNKLMAHLTTLGLQVTPLSPHS